MDRTKQHGTARPLIVPRTCSNPPVLGPDHSETQARCTKAAWTGARIASRIGAARSVGWISTGVPLATCVAVWGVGNVAVAQAPWLPVLHDAVGAAASVWTALQLALKGLRFRRARTGRFSWPTPGLLAMYALLILQPVLAAASSMLHGAQASMFGVPLPPVLRADPSLGRRVDLLHGLNALLLLSIIGWQITETLVALRDGRVKRRNPNEAKPRTTDE